MEEVMPEGLVRTQGKIAQNSNINAGIMLSEIIKTTLGPMGMDKLLVDQAGNITITNDGVTILEKMQIAHPSAKMIAEVSRTQEDEVGDGTTTVVMLIGELLRNAQKMIEKGIHPTTIIKGYKFASDLSLEILEDISVKEISDINLKSVAMTAMTGKGAESHRELLSDLIMEAVNKTKDKEASSDNIKIEMVRGKSIEESELISGIVFDKKVVHHAMPKEITNAKIAILDCGLEIKAPEIDTQVNVNTPDQLDSFVRSDKEAMDKMVEQITKCEANVVFCKKGIDEYIQNKLAKENIMAVRRINEYDIGQLARATGGTIISNIDDLDNDVLGMAESVKEEEKRDGSLIYVRGCENPKSVTLLICATTKQILEEIRRAVSDGLGDVIACYKEEKLLPGGGASEIELSKRLSSFAKTLTGREQLAVEEFAKAMETVPETLAKNAGLDSINVLTELKKKNVDGLVGLNLFNGQIEDTFKAGIIEPLKVKTQAIKSATEMANQLLRVDDLLVMKV